MINPTALKVREIITLLNTACGREVLTSPALRHDRDAAGLRIAGDAAGQTVNLFKYTAWLLDRSSASPAEPSESSASGTGYDRHRDRAARRQSEQSLSGRDIGALPSVADPERKAFCENNFRLFCETYFAESFSLAWSDDHLKVITRIEQAVLQGGLYALAMPRGSGKTTLAEDACIWAMLYGHRDFIALIGATETAALEMLDTIKSALRDNELLAADFPEICFPIAQMDGIANRCAGQLCLGKHTWMTWTDKEIVLPTIAGSRASGIIVRVAGITGRVRGMKFTPPTSSQSRRPKLVIVDDPQDDESAASEEQNRKRMRVLSGAILGLAGPGQKISGVMPCTVIRPGDMADQILDPDKHPDWNGERCKMLYSFPTDMKLWNQYAEIREDSLRRFKDIHLGTEFYAEHRAEMDVGARVYWPARYEPDEISAVQNAMNLYFRDPESFFAEYQNEPLVDDPDAEVKLTLAQLETRLNGFEHLAIPVEATRLTAFIDIQKKLLYYVVVAWTEHFGGNVIDYGAWPDQHRRYFSLNDANPTMQMTFPALAFEGMLYESLTALTNDLLGRSWQREDGAQLHIERCLIDSAWGESTDTVYFFCRRSRFGSVVIPSNGVGITAAKKPMTEYRKQEGDRLGLNWMIPNVRGKRVLRHVLYDTNYWKTFVRQRLLTALGDRGALTVYGRDKDRHRLLFDHWLSEYSHKTSGGGRTLDEWAMRPGAENHWWDGLVGCAVGASIQGVQFRPVASVPAATTSAPAAHSAPVRHFAGVVHRPNR